MSYKLEIISHVHFLIVGVIIERRQDCEVNKKLFMCQPRRGLIIAKETIVKKIADTHLSYTLTLNQIISRLHFPVYYLIYIFSVTNGGKERRDREVAKKIVFSRD